MTEPAHYEREFREITSGPGAVRVREIDPVVTDENMDDWEAGDSNLRVRNMFDRDRSSIVEIEMNGQGYDGEHVVGVSLELLPEEVDALIYRLVQIKAEVEQDEPGYTTKTWAQRARLDR